MVEGYSRRVLCDENFFDIAKEFPFGVARFDAARALLPREPEARVIVSRGYSNDPVMARYAAHGFQDVIAKPYRLGEVGAEPRWFSGWCRLPRAIARMRARSRSDQ